MSSTTPRKQGDHYLLKFNPKWLDKASSNYKDWISKSPNDEFHFMDLACNQILLCDSMVAHEKTAKHQNNYKSWKHIKESNQTLSNSLSLSNKILRYQCKIALFISKKNAPLSWKNDIHEMILSVSGDKPELSTSQFSKAKLNAILESLANIVNQNQYDELKKDYFSLLYDETSIKSKKYGAFILRRARQDFSQVYSTILAVFPMTGSDADKVMEMFKKHIIEKNIMNKLIGIGLDNANVMIGNNNSFKTRLLEIKSTISIQPCLLHIINLCEKRAFQCIPSELRLFHSRIYSYFRNSQKRSQKFQLIQKNLEIKPTLIPQACDTRWFSRYKCIKRINEKWLALEKYFEEEVQRKPRLLKLSELSDDDDDNSQKEEEKRMEKVEQFLKRQFEKEETKFYSLFLEQTLANSSKYIELFEKENYDVSRVYSKLKDFCSYYLNRIQTFESMNISIITLMKKIKDGTFVQENSLTDEEFERELIINFNFDLQELDEERKTQLISNMKNYYLEILKKFDEHLCLETSLYKYLEVLDFTNNESRNLEYWRYLISQFMNVVGMFNYSEIKKEIAELFNLDNDDINLIKKYAEKHSIMGWSKIKGQFNKDNTLRFKSLCSIKF